MPANTPPDPHDFMRALRAAMADPEGTHDPATQALLDRLSGYTPVATSCQPGQPLSSALPLVVPVRHDFCPHCGIDLFGNAESVTIEHVFVEDIEVRCDCGKTSSLPSWLFR